MRFLRRVWYIATGRRREADLADEMAFHREMKAQELRDRGVADVDIEAAIQRALGNDLLARERARDVWVWPWLQDVSQDLRFGVRMLFKERRFAAAAIVTLGLGIAVINAVFTVVNATLFRDLPFERADRLVTIRTQDPRGFPAGVSYPDFLDWQRHTTVFEEFCAELSQSVSLSDATQAAERLSGLYVSHPAFRTLRVTPVLGRDFTAEDDREGATAVTILSHELWRTRYASDAGIVGRTVRVNEQPTMVIGVMPEGFAYPLVTDLWMPMSMVPGLRSAVRTSTEFGILGRLKPSADITQARSEIETVAARIARDHPELKRDRKLSVSSLKASYLATGAGVLLFTLLGAAAVVLLIACANVANLLLARSWHRSREIAIRLAMGASRWRVVRQLLIECTLLTGGGALVGAFLSFFGVKALSRAFTVIELTAPDRPRRPYWFDPSMDGVAWMVFGLACLVASVAAGLIPALQLSRTGVNDVLKEGGRTSQLTQHARRWAGGLVVGQLAVALALVAGGALFARAFFDLYYTDLVIDTRDLVVMRLTLPQQKYGTNDQRQQFFRRLDERLPAAPAFSASTLSSDPPLYPLLAARRTLTVDGREPVIGETPPTAVYITAGPRYFDTVKLSPVRGRAFSADDGLAGREGAIVNQRFASMFFPNADPLGKRIQLTPVAPAGASVPWLTIVGVVPTLPDFLPNLPPDPVVYAPLLTESIPPVSVSVIVRASSKATAAAALREEVRALDADLPVFAIQTLDEAVALTRMGARMVGSWFQTLAIIAVVLALVGLYALSAHGVSQRAHEIGVRMALGARPHQVVWLFLRRTVIQLVIGFAFGMAGALFVGRLVAVFLGDTNPRDPLTLMLVSLVLAVVALSASAWPARQAARVDPLVALRTE
jgi:predicted permease